jgi:hypothetical protein
MYFNITNSGLERGMVLKYSLDDVKKDMMDSFSYNNYQKLLFKYEKSDESPMESPNPYPVIWCVNGLFYTDDEYSQLHLQNGDRYIAIKCWHIATAYDLALIN